MAWITDHPPISADLDSCVTCGLCLPVCPTFRLTGDESASPRGRLAAIAAVGSGVVDVDERFDEVTSFCLQCRACETACPSMVPYGRIIEEARGEAVAQLSPRRDLVRRLLLGRVLAMPVLLRVATLVAALLQRARLLRFLPLVGGPARGLRKIPLPLPTARGGTWGSTGPRATLFVGCVADPWFSGTHRAAIELLLAAGYQVDATSSQTCCGALAAHSGHLDEADRLAARNAEALAAADLIVADVAGCGAHLKAYDDTAETGARAFADRVSDITEVVWASIEEGRLPTLAPAGEVVALQDPCHLEHGQGITEQPRRILEAAGYEVIDADRGGLCCGAAGVYQLEHPATSIELGVAKAAKVRLTGARLVASANAGCEMQLRRSLGSGFRVAHPVEIYWEAWSTQRK